MTGKPEKPPYGDPTCNGCGACCLAEPCPIGAMVLQQLDGRCGALEDAGDRYVCGLVAHPRRYAPVRAAIVGIDKLAKAAALCIGSGVGCDAQAPGEEDQPNDAAYRERLRIRRMGKHYDGVAFALVMWLGPQVESRIREYEKVGL